MGSQGPYGPRTPGEGCEHSKVDGVWYRLYSVLKVSVHLGRDLAVPAPRWAGTLRSPHPRYPGKGAELLFEFIESHWAYSSVG